MNTLIEFEAYRKLENIVPSMNTNAFYNIGEGRINVHSIRDTQDDFRFNLYIDTGTINSGVGEFTISGDIVDPLNPYNELIITRDTLLNINDLFTCSNGRIDVYGSLTLLPESKLFVKNNGIIVMHPYSSFTVPDVSIFDIDETSSVSIYGKINIHISKVNALLNSNRIQIDSAAVLNVSGINETDRIFSLTDYVSEMRERYVNINTQGERNFRGGRIGYKWENGSPSQPSHILKMFVLYGRAVLGDFRLPILGNPININNEMQIFNDLVISKKSTLYISEEVENNKYFFPELYLGKLIGNSRTSATCVVDGKIIAEGENATITLDRNATLTISENGEVHVRDNAKIRSTNNFDAPVLIINGKLILDDIDQLIGFNSNNIVIGDNGKVVILNPTKRNRRIVLSIPNGIRTSKLYELFLDKIDKIEFHVSDNVGIKIDEFYESYSREMREWFGGRRFEKAIHDKILVWHNGAYIEFNNNITPWISHNSTLLVVGRIFKSFGSSDRERLQDVVNRLTSIGCGNIRFRFIKGERVKDVTLRMHSIKLQSIMSNSLNNSYILETDNSGILFIRNNIGDIDSDTIFNNRALKFAIDDSKKLEFILP